MACGVFAPIFSFFHLLRLSSWALPLLSLACPLGCLASDHGLVLSLFVGCCFFFPYGLYAKRKGAPCWCVLSCLVVGCGLVMQNMASRSRKIRNRWPRLLQLYIRQSMHIRNHSATARKNLQAYS